MGNPEPTWLDLYDYRQRVARMDAERERALRAGEDELAVLRRFRGQKDALFANHPQSPLDAEQRERFTGLICFPYNPAMRVEATLEPVADNEQMSGEGGPDSTPIRRAGLLHFILGDNPAELVVYWIDVYGGGLFLPFRDATCPNESYGGGRYLFDTVKGSDFLQMSELGAGREGPTWSYPRGRIILDFNYAYNPSCAYDARWVCPLAPRENWLAVAVRAGERKFC